MALATLTDVRRVLRITTTDATRDDQLTEALAVADSWFRARTRNTFDEVAPATAKFHVIRYGSIVHVPVPGSTVTAVRAGSAEDPSTLGSDSYVVLDDRRVRVGRVDPWPRDPREQEPLGWSDRPYYELVEIDYTPPSTVSAGVRDGVAHLAAAEWLEQGGGGDEQSNLIQERIGDYEYRLASGTESSSEDHRAHGLRMLRPFVGARISST